MKNFLIILMIIAAISTFFLQFETTTSKKISLEEKGIGDYIEISMLKTDFDRIAYAIGNLENKYHENNNLSFVDGLKNGFLVIASYSRDLIVGTICGYISGFYDKGFIMKTIWAIFGLFIEPIKNIITTFLVLLYFHFNYWYKRDKFCIMWDI